MKNKNISKRDNYIYTLFKNINAIDEIDIHMRCGHLRFKSTLMLLSFYFQTNNTICGVDYQRLEDYFTSCISTSHCYTIADELCS